MQIDLDWRRERSALWPEVSYEIRPLRVWAFQELMAYWERQAAPGTEGTGAADGLALLAVARRIFPDHVRDVQGLTLTREGETAPATPEALCEEAPLAPLAGEIVARLVAASEIGDDAEKK